MNTYFTNINLEIYQINRNKVIFIDILYDKIESMGPFSIWYKCVGRFKFIHS